MKILHTSDWHLGRMLYTRKERYDEHKAFLEWLLITIRNNSIDLLLVAGDIFDTASPSTASQKMYYDFLCRVKTMGCENVIVVGGNHDSPSFLNAPRDILASLNVTVIGNATENIEDEIVIVNDKNNCPKVIVCGVPFLRERDISRFAEAESYSDRSTRVNTIIKKHYEAIALLAEKRRQEIGSQIPIIATGHLSVLGGKRNKDDGVRDSIYIGNVEAIGVDIFPNTFDYVALGHYHIPSKLKEHIRYCGSPIPMGFGEANQQKVVCCLDFDASEKFTTIEIPTFQNLESIVGNKSFIEQRLNELKSLDVSYWIEVIYQSDEIFPTLSEWVNDMVRDSKVEVLNCQNRQQFNEVLTANDTTNSLEELNLYEVFDKLLDKAGISDEQKNELKDTYKEVVEGLNIEE